MLVALLWSVALHATAGAPPSPANLEYSVKANYLVRFAAFVEWPSRSFATNRSPVVICVVGRDPFGGALGRAARDQTAHGRAARPRAPPKGSRPTTQITTGERLVANDRDGHSTKAAKRTR